MKGDLLFLEYYQPGLIRHDVQNVALRTYTHLKGRATDDPDNSTEIIFTPRSEVDDRMRAIFKNSGEARGMAITSIVTVGTRTRFLFLLDCALPACPENDTEMISLISRLRGSFPALADGMLLRTQQSYHLVGFEPLSLESWLEHMARAILLKTRDGRAIADTRYIGHSIERQYGSLRVSDYAGKPTPDFICYFMQ